MIVRTVSPNRAVFPTMSGSLPKTFTQWSSGITAVGGSPPDGCDPGGPLGERLRQRSGHRREDGPVRGHGPDDHRCAPHVLPGISNKPALHSAAVSHAGTAGIR